MSWDEIITPGEVLYRPSSSASVSTLSTIGGSGSHTLQLSGSIYSTLVGIKTIKTVNSLTSQQLAASTSYSSSPRQELQSVQVVSVKPISPPAPFPRVGDFVTARITRITPRNASAIILAIHRAKTSSAESTHIAHQLPPASLTPATVVTASSSTSKLTTPAVPSSSSSPAPISFSLLSSQLLSLPLPAVIRSTDIRSYLDSSDPVSVSSSFRPGDLIRAEIVSGGASGGGVGGGAEGGIGFYLSTARNELGVVGARSQGSGTGGGSGGRLMIPVSWKVMMDPVTGQKESRKVAKIEATAATTEVVKMAAKELLVEAESAAAAEAHHS